MPHDDHPTLANQTSTYSSKKSYVTPALCFAGSLFFATNAYTSFLNAQTFEQRVKTYSLISHDPHAQPQETHQFYSHIIHQSKHTYEDKTNWQSLASMLLFIIGQRALRNGRTRTAPTEEQPSLL